MAMIQPQGNGQKGFSLLCTNNPAPPWPLWQSPEWLNKPKHQTLIIHAYPTPSPHARALGAARLTLACRVAGPALYLWTSTATQEAPSGAL